MVSDDVDGARAQAGSAGGVSFHPRSELDAVQRSLREHPGVSALIYVQPCATELRRRRKRKLAVDPDLRIFINERVCEGCGDCSAKSNCIAVEPVETEFGRKRRIDQSACNKDQACVTGFCPSFVTAKGARPRKSRVNMDAALAALPERQPPALTDRPYNIVLAGIGGQGVTSLAAIMDMAAHLDGGAVNSVDMLGMAQKGGGVFVHLRLADAAQAIVEPRIAPGQADLVLANDMIVAHGRSTAPLVAADRTTVVLNTALAPSAEFVEHNGVDYDTAAMQRTLSDRAARFVALDASQDVAALMGDAIFTNMFLLGHAWQLGLVPLSRDGLERAIDLNGTQAAANKQAFALGRLSAHDPAAVRSALPAAPVLSQAFADVLTRRVEDLTAYQNAAYAERYRAAIQGLADAETRAYPGSTQLALAAARSLYRLMAYKDEYEVARLYTDGAFQAGLKAAFEGEIQIQVHLAPPLFGRRDAAGNPVKTTFGPWMLTAMRALAPLKVLRGTPLDPFSRLPDRREERALRDDFLAVLGEVTRAAGQAGFADLLAVLEAPGLVRGYGHIKAANAALYQAELGRLRIKANLSPAL